MQIQLKKHTLPLRHTFSISRESHDFQDTLIVGLTLNDKTGYGEATSNPYYKITVESMMAEIEAIRTSVKDYELTDPKAFHQFPGGQRSKQLRHLCVGFGRSGLVRKAKGRTLI